MSMTTPNLNRLVSLSDDQLFAELGQAIKSNELEMLPDGQEDIYDEARGKRFFELRLDIIKQMICTAKVTEYVRDEKKRDIASFVSALIDVVSGYFGVPVGTIILVQVYKIGVDQFCEKPDSTLLS